MAQFSPLPRSTWIRSFEWTAPEAAYPEGDIKGDSFPFTWAEDGELYASAGDPLWGETRDGLDFEKFTGGPPDYKITKINSMNDYRGWGGDGPKPTGLICVEGVLYLAFQNLLRNKKAPFSLLSQHGSDAHIIYSTNKGTFWTPALQNIQRPMFPGHHFGGPAFINFGQNNQHARDDFIYAVSPDQWDNGSNLRIGRVPKDQIIRAESWEFLCAFGAAGEPAWSPDLGEAIPILSLHRRLGLPDMVYLAAIKRYLLLTWTLHKDFSPDHGSDLLILDSPEPWGPFSIVHAESPWETVELNPYCPRIPLKWMAEDHLSGHIQFSGSWAARGHVPHGAYRSHTRGFRMALR